MRVSLFVILFVFYLSQNGWAQSSFKGIWSGNITTDGLDAKAGFIMSIEEHKDDIVSGKALLYKPNLFADAYGLIQFIGLIKDGRLRLNELVILDEKRGHKDYYLCIKNSLLEYKKSDSIESLSGTWNSNTLDCLPGQIFLKRLDLVNGKTYIPPYVLKAIRGKNQQPTFRNTQLAAPIIMNVQKKVLDIEIKDYLKEDNDTVSIYLNRKEILPNFSVKKKGMKFKLHLDKNLELNELIIVAENLGKVPPNTSQLIIFDGINTHNLLIESDLQKSAALYLRYKPE